MMDFAQWYLKTVGIPLESAKARGVADLDLMEQCWKEAQAAARTTDRCQCGYPMPCSVNVPIGFCKA